MRWFLFPLCLLAAPMLDALTIDEKKAASISREEGCTTGVDCILMHVNEDLISLRSQLKSVYLEAAKLQAQGAKEEEFEGLLRRVNEIKEAIVSLENTWRETAVAEAKKEEEGYALWDQEETTLAQLVLEYGAMDFLYIVPPEMSGMKVQVYSAIPIPRESWGEVLEIILAQNGVGVKKLNSYAKQLFLLKQDVSTLQSIVTRAEDLRFVPNQSRVFFLLSPPIEQAKSVFQFFERFSDVKQTFVYQVGGKIALVAPKEEVEKLLTLYQTVWNDNKGKITRVVPLSKMSVKEMEKILHSFFGDAMEKNRMPFGKPEPEGLMVFPLSQGSSLVLIGSKEVVDRAEKMIRDTEEQLQDPSEMTVYLYPCKHSDPTDLSHVLEKVYSSLLYAAPEGAKESVEVNYAMQGAPIRTPDGYAPTPPLVANPPSPMKPAASSQVEVEQSQGTDHFIPDPKTGTILMVVRRDTLPKIKDLLRKLDVPKKMVQIEVLLFEKRLNNQNNFGLNLLKLGKHKGVSFESINTPRHLGERKHKIGNGVLEFFYFGSKHKYFPAFEVAYNFLMTQEDIQLNAAPSIVTVNQTPATISIVEEISINNGAAPIDTNKGIAFEKSFSRAQYGITLILTPTVHLPDCPEDDPEGKGFVTMQTDITFDTTKPSLEDRPLVDKRHIENEVRVVDGETVILGGLRRKSSRDFEEKLPFLGEIPGIGKLFGTTRLSDDNTEMFFFITPKIILDPKEEMERMRQEDLKKRAGDLPEFLERVVEARNKEKKKFFQESMKIFWNPQR